MFVAARSANRPGSETFILRIAGTSSGNAIDQLGERLGGRHDARDEVVDLGRIGRRLSRGAGSRAIGIRLASARSPRSTMRRSPCSVICTVSPGRLMRSCTRAATPTRPTNARGSIGSSWSPLATTSATISPASSLRAEEREVLRRAHLHRDRAERIDDRRAQRHQRQRRRQLGLEDLVLALGCGPCDGLRSAMAS